MSGYRFILKQKRLSYVILYPKPPIFSSPNQGNADFRLDIVDSCHMTILQKAKV